MSEDIRKRADQLAELMDEFRLESARLKGDDWKIEFRKNPKPLAASAPIALGSDQSSTLMEADDDEPAAPSGPTGTPVTSPMTGIYYAAPNPNSPAFVKEGEVVNAGQVVALIEAMKVFNEIVAPLSGTVTKISASNGDVVNPGDPLLYIG